MDEATWSRNWQAAHEKKERAKMANDEVSYPLEVAQERQAYIEQLEQQLAQTKEELRIALAQRQDYRAALAQAREESVKQDETIEFLHIVIDDLKRDKARARALLEEFAVDETERIGLYWDESVGMAVCVYCESGNGHLPDCPIVKARAFLGKEA